MAVMWVVVPCSLAEVYLRDPLLMEAASTSETLPHFYQTTRRNNPEYSHLHARSREDLKSNLTFGCICVCTYVCMLQVALRCWGGRPSVSSWLACWWSLQATELLNLLLCVNCDSLLQGKRWENKVRRTKAISALLEMFWDSHDS
jgi:hypothetical protein